jgi:hypothetical protein
LQFSDFFLYLLLLLGQPEFVEHAITVQKESSDASKKSQQGILVEKFLPIE